MTITIKVFEHLFDETPVETHTFETDTEAQEWLQAQPGKLTLEIEES